jgi:YggT family protein
MGDLICKLAYLYLVILFARILLSWFPIAPGTPMATVFSFVYSATEPVLGPVRRLMPPMGMGGLDLSPLIVILFYQLVILRLVCG